MPAFSFEAQTKRVEDVCLHFILPSFFFHPFNNFLSFMKYQAKALSFLYRLFIFLYGWNGCQIRNFGCEIFII